jgi:hypothetical protein
MIFSSASRPPAPIATLRPRALARGVFFGFALVFFALTAAPAGAQASIAEKELLRAEFWADLEPVAKVGEEWPVSAETARARIREEAAWVFGGMIWGFEFSYTPYDKTRSIPERFEILPIGSLPPDSLSFAAGARRSSMNELRSYVEYRPEVALVELMAGYAHDPWKGCQGIGKADMNLGLKGRRAAYEDGLRAALRSLLQGLEPNKPRLVRGRVILDRPPSMSIQGGYYTAQLRARAMIIEVLPYKIF